MKRPFVVNHTLTSYAIGYTNPSEHYIADDALPRVDVMSEKFGWTKYSLEEGFAVPDNRVGRTGRVNRIELSGSEETASVEDFGLEVPIPYTDIDEAEKMREQNRSTFDPKKHAAKRIKTYNQNNREIRVAKLIQDPNTYHADRRSALTGSAMWSDYGAGSDPISDIKDAQRSTLVYRPNVAVMGDLVWHFLSSHPALVSAINGNSGSKGIITKEEFAKLFGFKKVLVGDTQKNIAAPGQQANLSKVWGNTFQLYYLNPEARTEDDVTFGLTAEYGNLVVMEHEDKDVGLKGGIALREGERLKELIMAPDVGYQIQNVVSE